jgi:hypothetical protein
VRHSDVSPSQKCSSRILDDITCWRNTRSLPPTDRPAQPGQIAGKKQGDHTHCLLTGRRVVCGRHGQQVKIAGDHAGMTGPEGARRQKNRLSADAPSSKFRSTFGVATVPPNGTLVLVLLPWHGSLAQPQTSEKLLLVKCHPQHQRSGAAIRVGLRLDAPPDGMSRFHHTTTTMILCSHTPLTPPRLSKSDFLKRCFPVCCRHHEKEGSPPNIHT